MAIRILAFLFCGFCSGFQGLYGAVNVMDYHAGPHRSAAENDAAFARAVADLPPMDNVSGGGMIYVPSGTYDLSATWAWGNKSVTLRGDGRGKTILRWVGANDMISGSGVFCNIKDVSLRKQTNTLTIANTLNFATGTHYLILADSEINGSARNALLIDSIMSMDISNCVFDALGRGVGNGVNITNSVGSADTLPTTCRIRNCTFNHFNTAVAWGPTFGTNADNNIFFNCNTAIAIAGGNTHKIHGSWCEWTEGSAAGKCFLNVCGPHSVNIQGSGNRMVGRDGPAYYRLTEGALRSQLQIMEGQATGIVNPTLNIARCQLENSLPQTIGHNLAAPLQFNQKKFDTDAMHRPSEHPSRITFNTAGTYLVSAAAGFPIKTAAPHTFCRLTIMKNGVPVRHATQPAAHPEVATQISLSALVQVVAGDYVQLVAYQNSGLPVEAAAGGETVFEAAWLGS